MRRSTWLMSGTVIATPTLSPVSTFSATMNQLGSNTSCRSPA